MNIFALIATLSLNYSAIKAKQIKLSLAPTVIMALNDYSLLSLPFPKALKEHLRQLVAVPPAAPALPQVVIPAKYSSLTRETEEGLN